MTDLFRKDITTVGHTFKPMKPQLKCLRQKNHHDFKDSLGYIHCVHSGLEPCSKTLKLTNWSASQRQQQALSYYKYIIYTQR